MTVIDQVILDRLKATKIFFHPHGIVKFKVGDTIHAKSGSVLENYSQIFSGNVLPFRMGCFSYSYSPLAPGLTIGRYCSIGQGVTLGGASHPYRRVSTSPFSYLVQFQPGMLASLADCGRERPKMIPFDVGDPAAAIENDVWIGDNVTIRRGVTIGNGAVVGANALVNEDVPPYAIVGGTPAKIIKFRFPERVIARMIDLSWWSYHFADIMELDVESPMTFLEQLSDKVQDKTILPYHPGVVIWDELIAGT